MIRFYMNLSPIIIERLILLSRNRQNAVNIDRPSFSDLRSSSGFATSNSLHICKAHFYTCSQLFSNNKTGEKGRGYVGTLNIGFVCVDFLTSAIIANVTFAKI